MSDFFDLQKAREDAFSFKVADVFSSGLDSHGSKVYGLFIPVLP